MQTCDNLARRFGQDDTALTILPHQDSHLAGIDISITMPIFEPHSVLSGE